MNQSISPYYAHARQDEIERRVAARRVADDWQPAPPGNLADRIGKSLAPITAITAGPATSEVPPRAA